MFNPFLLYTFTVCCSAWYSAFKYVNQTLCTKMLMLSWCWQPLKLFKHISWDAKKKEKGWNVQKLYSIDQIILWSYGHVLWVSYWINYHAGHLKQIKDAAVYLLFCCLNIFLEICTFSKYQISKTKNLVPRIKHSSWENIQSFSFRCSVVNLDPLRNL